MSKTVLVRLAWNSLGWRQADTHGPSDGGFPAKTGRAGEDWNFALQDVVKGKLVGFSQGLPGRKEVKASGGRFNVVFFAKHPENGYGIVGVYRDAELLGELAQKRWWKLLKDKNIIDERFRQVEQLLDREGAEEFVKDKPISWLVELANVLVFDEIQPLPEGFLSLDRYTNAFKVPDPSVFPRSWNLDSFDAGDLDDTGFDVSGTSSKDEGRMRLHLRNERKRGLAAALKRDRKNKGKLKCEACGLKYVKKYGDAADALFDAHHPIPLAKVPDEGIDLTIEDLVLLCANCHRVAHRTQNLTLKELSEYLDSVGHS